MSNQMKKDQRSLAKILDALDGLDSADIRKILRAAAIFHGVQADEIRYLPSAPIVVERPWLWSLSTPVWTSQTLEMESSCHTTTSDARYAVTNSLLEASNQASVE